MDAVYPSTASALARGRRRRRREPRLRHRTAPVTFAEIKEVDEEDCGEEEGAAEGDRARSGDGGVGGGEERRRRPDLLDERLGRQFAEFRRRRARADALRELSPPLPGQAPARAPTRAPPVRALSEPGGPPSPPEAGAARPPPP